jgi:hypothetical protein
LLQGDSNSIALFTADVFLVSKLESPVIFSRSLEEPPFSILSRLKPGINKANKMTLLNAGIGPRSNCEAQLSFLLFEYRVRFSVQDRIALIFKGFQNGASVPV